MLRQQGENVLVWRLNSPDGPVATLPALGAADAAQTYMTTYGIPAGARIYVNELPSPPPTIMFEAGDEFVRYMGRDE